MAQVTLRPDDQITTHDGFGGTDWTYSSAGVNDGAPDLADSVDATIWFNGNPGGTDHAIFAFQTFAVPAGARIVSVQIKLRFSSASAVELGVWDQVNAGGQRYVGSLFGPVGLGDYGLNVKTDSPSFVEWTQADIDGLRVTLEQSTGVGSNIRELYAVVIYNEPATVQDVTVPLEIREDPAVTFAYVDPEFEVQGGYQIKTFTSAVVNGGGFNPDSSANVHDTGNVSGNPGQFNPKTVTLTAANLSPGRYYSYIRVRDVTNGAWSAWVGSNEYRVINSPLMVS